MSHVSSERSLPAPRIVTVVTGMASASGQGYAPLEHARLDALAAIAAAGRVARLRMLSPLLPPCELTVAAALLGHTPPDLIDRAAVAAAALGLENAVGDRKLAVLIDVLAPSSEPAPVLDVARAADHLDQRLPKHDVHLVPFEHRLLVTGTSRPPLPVVDGLDLRVQAAGWMPPSSEALPAVVVAEVGSPLIDVARLLGVRNIAIEGMRVGKRRTVDVALRDAAIAELASGARTLVVETRALVPLRLRPRDPSLRRRELVAALEAVDRALIGPLRAAADWCGAGLVVTSDLPRDDAGRVARGDVPIVVLEAARTASAGAAVGSSEVPFGLAFAPPYAESSLAGAPIVTSPWAAVPDLAPGPRRFVRDLATGVTHAATAS